MSNETTNTQEQIAKIFEADNDGRYNFPWNIVKFYQDKSDLKSDYLCKMMPQINVCLFMLDLFLKYNKEYLLDSQVSSLTKILEDLKSCDQLGKQYWEDLNKIQMPESK